MTDSPRSAHEARQLLKRFAAAQNQREQHDYLYAMPAVLEGLIEQLQAVRRDYETAELGCQQLEGINRELQEQYEIVRDKWITLDQDHVHLKEQLEAEQQRRLQAVSLIPYEVWNELSRETRLRLTDGLAPVRPVSNPASVQVASRAVDTTRDDASGLAPVEQPAPSPASDPYAGRCPVCEGLDYPGLNHNPDAPYCSEASVPASVQVASRAVDTTRDDASGLAPVEQPAPSPASEPERWRSGLWRQRQ